MVKKSVVSVLLGLATSLALSPAFAQENAIEEIIVTASKRAQTLQEVPIAVSVVSGEQIEKAQVNDILDLQSMVPSLRVTSCRRDRTRSARSASSVFSARVEWGLYSKRSRSIPSALLHSS